MSYIRCTSNPECLYVWSDCSGDTYFVMGQGDCSMHRSMPNKVWEKFREWWQTKQAEELWWCDDGFRWFYKDVCITVINQDPKHDWRIYFKYETQQRSWDMVLWPVTWCYLMPTQHTRWMQFAQKLQWKWWQLRTLLDDAWWWFKESVLEIE